MIDNVVTLAAVIGGRAAFLWFREFRTIRTVALLSVSTALLLVASLLPAPAPLVISVAVVLLLLAIHFS